MIAISQAAFEAIARTLPFGFMSFENKIDQNGERLRALRGPEESLQRRDPEAGGSEIGGDDFSRSHQV